VSAKSDTALGSRLCLHFDSLGASVRSQPVPYFFHGNTEISARRIDYNKDANITTLQLTISCHEQRSPPISRTRLCYPKSPNCTAMQGVTPQPVSRVTERLGHLKRWFCAPRHCYETSKRWNTPDCPTAEISHLGAIAIASPREAYSSKRDQRRCWPVEATWETWRGVQRKYPFFFNVRNRKDHG